MLLPEHKQSVLKLDRGLQTPLVKHIQTVHALAKTNWGVHAFKRNMRRGVGCRLGKQSAAREPVIKVREKVPGSY